MARHTVPAEPTLQGKSSAAQDVELEADSNTVVDLAPRSLRPAPGKADTDAEAPEQTITLAVEHGSPERDAQPSSVKRSSASAGPLRTTLRALLWIVVSPFLGVLPFIVVLRISVVAYQEDIVTGWESLGIGIISAVLLICVYIAAFMWTFGIRRRFFMPLLNICLTAMLCYSGYALFHMTTANAKTAEVRSYYTSLHPFLRVAVKNVTLFDEDIVITDIQRTKDDYRSMGMSVHEYSLHFRQPTGFVHALDVRTKGRSRMANLMVELYFVLMGFETLRHSGTADHLHVALKP